MSQRTCLFFACAVLFGCAALLGCASEPVADVDAPAADAFSPLPDVPVVLDAPVVASDTGEPPRDAPVPLESCFVARDVVRVACAGDSITFGYGIDVPSETYPARLGVLLGGGYEVGNFGQNGASALSTTDTPYDRQLVYEQSNAFAPDVVVLQLGTNDSAMSNWARSESFEADYRALVEHYRSLGAFVLASLPPPVYGTTWFDIDAMLARLRPLLVELGTPVIDVHAALSGHPEWFSDGVHPTGEGAAALAARVHAAIVAHRCP